MKIPRMAEKNAEKIWKTTAWLTCDGDVPVMKAPRAILRWSTSTWWRNKSLWRMRVDPMHVFMMDTHVAFSQQAWYGILQRRDGQVRDVIGDKN